VLSMKEPEIKRREDAGEEGDGVPGRLIAGPKCKQDAEREYYGVTSDQAAAQNEGVFEDAEACQPDDHAKHAKRSAEAEQIVDRSRIQQRLQPTLKSWLIAGLRSFGRHRFIPFKNRFPKITGDATRRD